MRSTTQIALDWRTQVNQAALTFEARWTQASLRRLDPVLAEALHDQVNMFGEACVTGTATEIEIHGEATVKGYAQAVEAMQNADIGDDAYMLGTDMVTGTKVAIGTQKAAVNRVRQIHGNDVIWLTPDEVARMLAGIETFKSIGAIKKLFPVLKSSTDIQRKVTQKQEKTMTDRVFVQFGNWALGSDGIQWMLMRHRVEKRLDREPWQAISFVRSSRDVLARCMREKGVGDDAMRCLLAGLPDTFDEWKASGAS